MPALSDRSPADVLLVEDDPGDVLLVREAFDQHTSDSLLHVVTDGEQALQFLRREGQFGGVPRPGLILLDLNLPRRNGLDVLAEIRADGDLEAIPVVMLTTSRAPQDVLRSYQLHTSAYVTKPTDYEDFIAAVGQIDDFYLRLVQLPNAPADQ